MDTWQNHWAQTITDPVILWEKLALAEALLPAAQAVCRDFPLKFPVRWLNKIPQGELHHPLLRQVLPIMDENEFVHGFNIDAVGDLQARQNPGILHKYAGRVLLVATGACALHCRYCFRRHFPYQANHAAKNQWQAALQYIQANPDIHEVILSGGDPLALSNQKILDLMTGLAQIAHVQTIRFHTRVPMVIPERIDAGFCEILKNTRLKKVMVLHANCAEEFDQDIQRAAQKLRDNQVMLFNQAVLLRGVNDHKDRLIALSQALWDAGIVPYYLHTLDKVQGAAHFWVSDEVARQLVREMAETLPGYLVPKLVHEDAGAPYKTPVHW